MKQRTVRNILIGIVLTAGIGTLVWWQKSQTAQVPAPEIEKVGAVSATEVASHNSGADCWTSINGNVYDLTSWIVEHPGGEGAILQLCGTDGSDEFDATHGNSPQAKNALTNFQIGTLEYVQ